MARLTFCCEEGDIRSRT